MSGAASGGCEPFHVTRNNDFVRTVRARSASLNASDRADVIFYRYSMTGKDDLGYSMLYKAIDIADKLGYIGGEGQTIDLSNTSRDFYNSAVKTVWGLFQIDTLVLEGLGCLFQDFQLLILD